MQFHRKLYGAGGIGCAVWLLCAIPAGAQTGGNAGGKENTGVLTKEYLFEGTGLSAESQNKVLGNLLKYSQSPKSLEGGHFDMRVPAFPKYKQTTPAMAMGTIPFPSASTVSDPCASVADEKQLNAMHRLLAATLSSKSIDSAAFGAKVPKGCNAQRLRYYLNVTAQLFPDGSNK